MNSINNRLDILDSLRGIAAILVVFHHFFSFNGNIIKRTVNPIIWKMMVTCSELNHEAVLFFFVLSGFCIAIALKDKNLLQRATFNDYLYKRFKRILPVYWLSLLFTLLVGIYLYLLPEKSYQIKTLTGNLLFLQTSRSATAYWFVPYGNNGPLWSLAYEMYFYFYLPLFLLFLSQLKIRPSHTVQICFLFFTSLICILFNKFLIYIPLFAFLSYFIIWYSGFIVAQYYLKKEKNDTLFIIQFIICLIMIRLINNYVHSDSLIEILKGLLIASLFYFFFRYDLIKNNALVNSCKRILIFLLKRLGHGSFALYALHYPFLILFKQKNVDIRLQILLIIILLFICPILEKWALRQRFTIFKNQYLLIRP